MSMKTVFLGRTFVPNREMREFHFTSEVSKSYIERFERPIRPTSEEYLKKLGKLGEDIVRRLFMIEGITTVNMEPYQITIEKAPLFNWEGGNGLERQIVRAFREVFREHGRTMKVTGSLVQPRKRKPAQTEQTE